MTKDFTRRGAIKDVITVDMIENVSPSYETAPLMSTAAFHAAAYEIGPTLERHIKFSYLTGASRWPFKYNFMPCYLRETGALSQAVADLRVLVTPKKMGAKKPLSIHIMANWPRNKRGYEYVWLHEFGTRGSMGRKSVAGPFSSSSVFGSLGARRFGAMPRRSFIGHGIQQAGPEVSAQMTMPIAAMEVTLKNPTMVGVKSRVYTSRAGGGRPPGESLKSFSTPAAHEHGSFNYVLGPAAMATMLVPPIAPFSQLLLLWGASSDIASAIRGEMFEEGAIKNMVQAMAMGYMGLTPRSQRRRTKRRMWGTVL